MITNSRFTKIAISCLLILITFVLSIPNTKAQPSPLQTIYSNLFPIYNASWSNDGATFTFQIPDLIDGNVLAGIYTTEFEGWYTYNANQKMLSPKVSTTWGQYEQLASRLSTQVTLATHPDGAISFIFPSPNERYVVYAAPRQKGEPSGYPLAMIDVISGDTHVFPDIRTVYLRDFVNFYNVVWSAGSTAFIVQRNSGFSADLTTYVNITTANSTQLIDITEIPMNGKLYLTERKFSALSTDGKKAILPIYGGVDDFGLLIWNSEDGDNDQFIAAGQDVVSAMFTDDDQAVLYIDDNGLMKYNLVIGETLLVDASINSTWVDKAWFSPTGKQIALLKSDAPLSDLNTLYMYDIPPLK